MSTDATTHFEEQAELLDEWLEVRRQIAALEAKASGLLADRLALMDEDVADMPLHRDAIRRSMVAEFSSAGRLAKGSVDQAFSDALALHDDFPALRASLSEGRITIAHVREVIRAASALNQAIHEGTVSPATRRLYEAAALEYAETEAPARTRAHVRQLVAALVPQTTVERHRAATADQSVTVREIDDEMSLLQALIPTYRAAAIMDRLTAMARAQKQHPENRAPSLPCDHESDLAAAQAHAIFGMADTYTIDPFLPGEPALHLEGVPEPGLFDDPVAWAAYEDASDRAIAEGATPIQIPADTRGLDEMRAELLTDLLLGADPSEVMGTGLENIRARIQVTVAATTLAGTDDDPAQLDGHGGLDPRVARFLAGNSTGWTRLFLDPAGLVTETDTYTPTEPMRRFLRARDQHCRFPGCRMPVHRCETDHTIDWAKGGPTACDNLAHLCLTHHALKHPDVPDQHRWTARQLPDWTIEWTSPAGRTYLDRPERRVMFVPSEPEPAEPARAPREAQSHADRWAFTDDAAPPWATRLS